MAQNNKETIVFKYKRGQERDIVIEQADYDKSIFTDQYVQALQLVNALVEDVNNRSLKCVAFCGDRGEGKTSCMSTVRRILEESTKGEESCRRFIEKQELPQLASKKFFEVEVIDPSFFDARHNILEIVVSHLYHSFLNFSGDKSQNERSLSLKKAFTEVNASLQTMAAEEVDSLNDMHRLSKLATGVRLRDQIEELIKCFLEYVGCEFLVIPVDDIDLNIAHAYQMCEQIRKYLCVKRCLVFVSVKISQLQDVVATEMKSELGTVGAEIPKKTIFNITEVSAMAEKYVNKLIPVSSRINMPKAYSMVDFQLEIDGKLHSSPLKETIVQLIFSCTRYLFYNSYDGVSPIVPNNLRDLLNLISLLASMREIEDSHREDLQHDLGKNKRLFKSYFFTVWKNRFSPDLQAKLDALISFDFGTSFNKEVIAILKEHFEAQLKKDYNSNKEEDYASKEIGEVEERENPSGQSLSYLQLVQGIHNPPVTPLSPAQKTIQSIQNADNFGYNITVGDVFYLFSALESETLSESLYSLVFFLKGLYSIKLYEAYETITETEGMIYPVDPEEDQERAGLSIVDRRFDNSNKLQQLTGGSYFTYCAGDYIPFNSQNREKPYDLRVINGKALNELLRELKNEYSLFESISKMKPEDRAPITQEALEIYTHRLRLAEFFMLTIKAAVPQKQTSPSDPEEANKIMEFLRKNVDAWHYRKFYANTGFYLFDIMAPFGTMLNVEFTYRRFDAVDKEFFEFIRDFEGSLLHSIKEVCWERREYTDNEERVWYSEQHKILSDSAIRNAEVLVSVIDLITHKRKLTHSAGRALFYNFYDEILNSGMKTQKIGAESKPYAIDFEFLNPLRDLMKEIGEWRNKSDKGEELDPYQLERLEMFNRIFNQKESPKKNWEPNEEDLIQAVGYARAYRTVSKRLRDFLEDKGIKKIDRRVWNELVPNLDRVYTDQEIESICEHIVDHLIVRDMPEPEDVEGEEPGIAE